VKLAALYIYFDIFSFYIYFFYLYEIFLYVFFFYILIDSRKKDDVKEISAAEAKENKEQAVESSFGQSGFQTTQNKIIASDFLKSRINEIKKFNKPTSSPASTASPKPTALAKPVDCGFDLELYIGDKPTSQKLLDASSKYKLSSPMQPAKRKLDALSQNSTPGTATAASCDANNENLSAEERRAKKIKMIEELQGIKSSHAKDVMDPEKNAHYKSYLDKLQMQEDIDNKLTAMRNREVRVVSCKTCAYTSFSQSGNYLFIKLIIISQYSLGRLLIR
jgi:predicted nucleic-acid-binding Zn-ribbon protein